MRSRNSYARCSALSATRIASTMVALSLAAVPGYATAQPAKPIDPNVAEDGLYVVVEATHRPLDGAAVMVTGCATTQTHCDIIATVMSNDMRLSGVVRSLGTGRKIASLQKSPVPHFDVQRNRSAKMGITWAIGLKITRQKVNKKLLQLQMQALNVKTSKLLHLGRHSVISGPASKARRLAHKASNAIFGALTGIEGSFDDHIFFSSRGPSCGRCIWRCDADGHNARVVVGDKGIHMLPRPARAGGVLYVSFRTPLPAIFRLSSSQIDTLFDLSMQRSIVQIPSRHREKRRRKGRSKSRWGKHRRGGKKQTAKLPPSPPPPTLPAAARKPFAAHSDLQFRTAAQAKDGRIVATINDGEQADLWLLDAAGQRIRNLTNHEADDLDPSWSPDGKRIAFVSNRSGRPQIYVVRLDGTGLERMTFAGPYNTGPDWGHDNKIVYSGLRGGAVDILTVDTKKQMQRLTPGRGRRSLEPSWTTCGRRVVYVSDEDGGGPRLWIASHDGAVREPLALPASRYYTPVWRKSPGTVPRRFRP